MVGSAESNHNSTDRILVCGLGSLGQHCVRELVAFGVRVSGIDLHPIQDRDVAEIASLMDQLFHGDCRDENLLSKIEIDKFRAILLVTSKDRANIEAAMTARMLNPDIRVVMRSSKEELNALLTVELDNFVSFEPSTLSAPAFAMAAMSDERLAQFQLKGQRVQVFQHRIASVHVGQNIQVNHFIKHNTVVLGIGRHPFSFHDFYHYHPDDYLREDDIVVTLSVSNDQRTDSSKQAVKKKSGGRSAPGKSRKNTNRLLFSRNLLKTWQQLVHWIQKDQIRRVAFISSTVLFLLLILGGFSFFSSTPKTSLVDSLYATVVLILGGYADLLGGELDFEMPVPWWLRLFGLLLTISGTLFVGLVYAVFTQYFLGMRFKFKRDIPIPESEHVIVYAVRRVGLVVTKQLTQFGQTLVGMDDKKSIDKHFPYVSLNDQSLENSLIKANVRDATCLVALARDELENLEVGLLARSISPDIKLVIRTHDSQFSKKLAVLWPKAHILSTASLAAEAMAAAAFGENVPFLFRLGDKTILVTEYRVEPGDTLVNRTLGSFSYGFGVLPLLLVKANNKSADNTDYSNNSVWLPPDDNILQKGDTLYVLATIDKIKLIELDQPLEANYRLFVEKPLSDVGLFEGANVLSRMTGKDISFSRRFMSELPGPYPEPVYLHQGLAMVVSLQKNMVRASLEEIEFVDQSSL